MLRLRHIGHISLRHQDVSPGGPVKHPGEQHHGEIARQAERLETLLTRQTASQAQYDAAFAARKQAEAEVAGAKAARGWYRRMPSPVIELRDVTAAEGTDRSRTFRWVVRYACAVLLVVAGVVMLAANFA